MTRLEKGEVFGRLTVDYFLYRENYKDYYRLTCKCGNEVVKLKYNLTSGHTSSCGCLRRERLIKALSTRNGDSRKPLWPTYKSMLERCNNQKATSYQRYGGRGIRVCDRWTGKEGFANFTEDMGERPDGMTLDRIDNDRDYEPSNCRWATRKQQSNNTSRKFTAVNGKGLSLEEASEYYGVKKPTLVWRKSHWGALTK